jgi:hypothetical protein
VFTKKWDVDLGPPAAAAAATMMLSNPYGTGACGVYQGSKMVVKGAHQALKVVGRFFKHVPGAAGGVAAGAVLADDQAAGGQQSASAKGDK